MAGFAPTFTEIFGTKFLPLLSYCVQIFITTLLQYKSIRIQYLPTDTLKQMLQIAITHKKLFNSVNAPNNQYYPVLLRH